MDVEKAFQTPAGASESVLRPREEDELIDDDDQKKYRSGVGMGLWLAKHSRPDIANAIREASKVMDGATLGHYKYLMRVMKYLVHTMDSKLKFEPSGQKDGWRIDAYCDSDFSGDKDTRRSVTGYVVYFMNSPVAWCSRSQKGVTLSSTEAEYVAISEVVTEIIFVRNLLKFLEVKVDEPVQINVDNIGAIYMAGNACSGSRTKHVDTRFHYVRELIEQGVVQVNFVKSENNDADMFTKNLSKEIFLKHGRKLMSAFKGTESA